MSNLNTYLVTGASRGIGRELALYLASLGHRLILLSSKERDLEKTYDEIISLNGPKPLICTFNLESAVAKDYDALISSLTEAEISLDGLFHFAGLMKPLKPLSQTPVHEWLQIMQVNLNARFILTKACLPFLEKSRRAKLVFALSDKAFSKASAYFGAYQTAEHGTRTLYELYCQELEQCSVQVMAIHLPNTLTRLRRTAFPFEEEDTLIKPHDLIPAFKALMDEKRCHGDMIEACAHIPSLNNALQQAS